jgi:hypothetical protein
MGAGGKNYPALMLRDRPMSLVVSASEMIISLIIDLITLDSDIIPTPGAFALANYLQPQPMMFIPNSYNLVQLHLII